MFGRSKRKKPSKGRKRLPKRQLAPVEEIAEQGLMVAGVAVRMTVKNEIIKNALQRKLDYHANEIIEMVQNATLELADERDRDAEHIDKMRGEIRDTGRSRWSESDYGNDDSSTLRHRQQVYELIAKDLRERAQNEQYLAETASKARDLAWHEIGDSLAERATHPYYSGGHDQAYRDNRGERIQQLIEKDLPDLIKQQSKKPSKVKRHRKQSGDGGGEAE